MISASTALGLYGSQMPWFLIGWCSFWIWKGATTIGAGVNDNGIDEWWWLCMLLIGLDVTMWLAISMALGIWISSMDNEAAHRQKGVWKDILRWQCAFDTTRRFCMVTTVSNMFSAVFGESALTGCHNIGFWAILLEDEAFGEFALIWCGNIAVWHVFQWDGFCWKESS